jgi:hypothetical protein
LPGRLSSSTRAGNSSSSGRLRQVSSNGFPQLRLLDVCGCAALQGSNAAAAEFRAFREALVGLPQLKGGQG